MDNPGECPPFEFSYPILGPSLPYELAKNVRNTRARGYTAFKRSDVITHLPFGLLDDSVEPELFHKTPFNSTPLVGLATPVLNANPLFNFDALLHHTLYIKEEANWQEDPAVLSPFASPCVSPNEDFEDLGDLSDLTPLSSPILHATEAFPSQSDHPTSNEVLNDLGLLEEPALLSSLNPTSLSSPTPTMAGLGCPSQLGADGSPIISPSERRCRARRRARSHHNRKKKRAQERDESFSNYKIRESIKAKYIETCTPIHSELKTEESNVAKGAFVAVNDGAVNDGAGNKKTVKLEDLVGDQAKVKFQYVAWDGRTPTPVCDSTGREIGLLAGVPDLPSWPRLAEEAADALESARPRLSLSKAERAHRRGRFPALRCGVSHGCGSTSPGNLYNIPQNTEVLEELNSSEPFRRLAGFASSVMASQAPKLYHHYVENLVKLHVNHPSLKRLFPGSVFASVSYNFGPRTVCHKHKDFANVPFGLWAVTALGDFDPQKGGHLILWDCHLVIEFPAGSTILLPSAIVAHSNIPISTGERRYSFAQYTSGGLFRWIQNKFQLAESFLASLSEEERIEEEEKNEQRWAFGLSLLECHRKTS